MLFNSFDQNTYNVEVLSTANTAGNATVTVGLTQCDWWELMSLYFTLTTDATVADRYAILEWRRVLVPWAFTWHTSAQAASLTINNAFLPNATGKYSTTTQLHTIELPTGLILRGNENIRLSIINGVAGDLISNTVWTFKRWKMPYNL